MPKQKKFDSHSEKLKKKFWTFGRKFFPVTPLRRPKGKQKFSKKGSPIDILSQAGSAEWSRSRPAELLANLSSNENIQNDKNVNLQNVLKKTIFLLFLN